MVNQSMGATHDGFGIFKMVARGTYRTSEARWGRALFLLSLLMNVGVP